MFKLFNTRVGSPRKILVQKDTTLILALEWLDNDLTAVSDANGKIFYSKKQLEEEYAESIRPEPRIELNSFFTSGKKIPEDSDRKLPESDSDRTESSTKRDN